MKRPSQLMKDALSGFLPVDQAPAAWLSFIVYKYAHRVLQGATPARRRDLLEQVPDAVRELVEKEARRLHKMRNCKDAHKV